MPITVRAAERSDMPAILAIYNDAVLHTTASYDFEPRSLDGQYAWFDAKQQQQFPVVVVADDAAGVIGWSSFGSFRVWPGYLYTVEHSIYVAPGRRGQGIGKLLLPPLIEAAKERKLHAMVGGIDAANIASLKLHAHFGFEQVAYFKQVGFKFGRWLDLIFMQLLLDEGDRPWPISR